MELVHKLGCGCQLCVDGGVPAEYTWQFCHLHAAAAELRKAWQQVPSSAQTILACLDEGDLESAREHVVELGKIAGGAIALVRSSKSDEETTMEAEAINTLLRERETLLAANKDLREACAAMLALMVDARNGIDESGRDSSHVDVIEQQARDALALHAAPARVVNPKEIYPLDEPIANLRLPARAINALDAKGIRTIGQLAQYSETDLLSIRDLGESTLCGIRAAMKTVGLRIRRRGEP